MSELLESQELSYEEERGKPMPSRNHARAQMNLGFEFKRDNRFDVLSELTLQLGTRPLTPDLSVYPKRPIDWSNDVVRETEPPLAVVEIFSPSQGYLDVMEHVATYLEAGVKSVWVLVPPLRTITIYHAQQPPKTFSDGKAVDHATGLEVEVGAVFS